MKSRILTSLAITLVATLAVSAADAQCKPFASKISLSATKLGASLGAIGTSGITVDEKCHQLFGLTVSGKIADGETVTVVITKGKLTYRIGGMKMFGGFGQLVLDSLTDVSDVFPVTELTAIEVQQVTISKLRARTIVRPFQEPRILLEGVY